MEYIILLQNNMKYLHKHSIINSEFGKQLDGVITDEKGKFKFTKVALKEYEIEVSFIGYVPRKIKRVKLTKKKPDLSLKNIYYSFLLNSKYYVLMVFYQDLASIVFSHFSS